MSGMPLTKKTIKRFENSIPDIFYAAITIHIIELMNCFLYNIIIYRIRFVVHETFDVVFFTAK